MFWSNSTILALVVSAEVSVEGDAEAVPIEPVTAKFYGREGTQLPLRGVNVYDNNCCCAIHLCSMLM